jgi:D-amino-acid dehydrogenase
VRICVLGAGVVGVTTAWYLAQDGHEVTVIDRQAGPGRETSFANGGQVSAGHAQPWARPSVIPKMLAWLGREDAPLRFRLRADWAQWAWGLGFLFECLPGRYEKNTRALAGLAAYSRESLVALRKETGLEYDALSRGILQFFTEARDLRAAAEHGPVKSAEECLEIEPALRHSEDLVLGGAYFPDDESGDAHRFTVGLAELAKAKGVRFAFDSAVNALDSFNGKISGLKGSDTTADAYVVALGSYSPQLLAPLGIRVPVYPLKGYSVTLPLGPVEQVAAPVVSLTDEAHKLVISRLGNRLRVAGTAELSGYDVSVDAARCNAILRRVRTLFPQLGAVTTVDRWAGLRPATPSNVPVIGATRYPNLFLNTGHGTLGWTLACGSARALAALIAGRKPEVEFPFRAC